MRKLVLLAVLFGLAGCAGGVRSSLIDVNVSALSANLPLLQLKSDMPVVYPYQAGGMSNDPMVRNFGPSWESLEPAYSEYRFNP